MVILGTQLRRSQRLLDSAQAAEAKRERQLNTVLEAEGKLMVAMLDTHNEHGTGVQFFWNVRQQRGMVHALPPAAGTDRARLPDVGDAGVPRRSASASSIPSRMGTH